MPPLSRRSTFVLVVLAASWPGLLGTGAALGRDGTDLTFRVDAEQVRIQRLDRLRDDVVSTMREEPLVTNAMVQTDGVTVTLRVGDEAQVAVARSRIERLAGALNGGPTRDVVFAEPQPGRFELSLTDAGLSERVRSAVENAVRVLRRRLDLHGASGIIVEPEGEDRLLVQVPAGRDVETVKRLAAQPGRLTFRLVDRSIRTLLPSTGQQSGSELLPSDGGLAVNVERLVRLSGDDLVQVDVSLSERGEPFISFRLNESGARRFAEVTSDNIGRSLAIVLDGRLLSAPTIREPILGGQGQISGSFSIQSANEFATLLRSGALPVRLILIEERQR